MSVTSAPVADPPRRRRGIRVALAVLAVATLIAGGVLTWKFALPSWQGRDDAHTWVPRASAVAASGDAGAALASAPLDAEFGHYDEGDRFTDTATAIWDREVPSPLVAGAEPGVRVTLVYRRFVATATTSGTEQAAAALRESRAHGETRSTIDVVPVDELGDEAFEQVSTTHGAEIEVRDGNVRIIVKYWRTGTASQPLRLDDLRDGGRAIATAAVERLHAINAGP